MRFEKGCIPWNKGKKATPEEVEKNRIRHLGQKAWNKGKIGIYSKESLEKMSEARMGKEPWNKGKHPEYVQEENNSAWKGNNVGYVGLHQWVTRRKGRLQKCDKCGIDKPKRKGYDWANISGEYKRDLDDFIRLCKSCHTKYDNNLENAWEARRLKYA